jgi:hypothetical protein
MVEVSPSVIAPIGHSGPQAPQPIHSSWSIDRWGSAGRLSAEFRVSAESPTAAALAAAPTIKPRRSTGTVGLLGQHTTTRQSPAPRAPRICLFNKGFSAFCRDENRGVVGTLE